MPVLPFIDTSPTVCSIHCEATFLGSMIQAAASGVILRVPPNRFSGAQPRR